MTQFNQGIDKCMNTRNQKTNANETAEPGMSWLCALKDLAPAVAARFCAVAELQD
jgi:hypothetical protein